MEKITPKCIKRVGTPCCPSCSNVSIKYGKSRSGKQRYRCKTCAQVFVEIYCYQAYLLDVKNWIVKLIKEGTGIRSISRLLKISCNTVQKMILFASKAIRKPPLILLTKLTKWMSYVPISAIKPTVSGLLMPIAEKADLLLIL